MTTESIDAFAERMVRNEVLCCVSSLVSTLASGYGGMIDHRNARDLCDLVDQAFDLASPVADYEEAAREAGWTVDERTGSFVNASEPGDTPRASPDDACGWEDLCCECDIEPYESEVYEHWAVSTWFAEKLAEHGEKIDMDFGALNVWARQCTGQQISADAVVLKIARECMEA